ncbi:MAG: argininosuccinate synthase, partial [Treponema sp.]|nr:argininosuccinate synthase [Treponema sp.]
SLYNASIASFTTGELYNHADAGGFIRLYGLPILVRALMERDNRSGKTAPAHKAKAGKPGKDGKTGASGATDAKSKGTAG